MTVLTNTTSLVFEAGVVRNELVIEKHAVASPETCDVCRYAVAHALDVLVEHTLVQAATVYLESDLESAPDGYLPLGAIATDVIGYEPGPVHPFEPRHWYWALLTERRIVLSLRATPEGAADESR